jgi:hypothetical protein
MIKRRLLAFAFIAPSLMAATLLSAENAANLPTVVGPIRCGISGYMWPLSPDAAPIATDVGTLEIVSDGHGNYTSGQMTEHLADDTHLAGSDVCIFELQSGAYIQQSDGTTLNTTNWKLRLGSDPHCGAFVTNSKNLGFIEGERAFRAFQRISTSYVLDDGRIVWVAANPQVGVAIGACEKVGK